MVNKQNCIIIGASHAGVNCAFALRKEGWEGPILLFDKSSALPYHRPPLSKAYLSGGEKVEGLLLKSAESYEKERITLHLNSAVSQINPQIKNLTLQDGTVYPYQKLVIATGAHPIIPPISGINKVRQIFVLRTIQDAKHIREALQASLSKKVVIIGGGYIGLETAASLHKLDAQITILEREDRILARVTAPEMSDFFEQLHAENGVKILTGKNVISFEKNTVGTTVVCEDGSTFNADLVIIGVGIQVNLELASKAGLEIKNGIRVDATTCTSDKNIYAIGDCTYHHNPHYNRTLRLESVQNAVDQAKVAAAAICGKQPIYDAIPWFWSDQYDIKLQIVGLSDGYDQALVRREPGEDIRFSIWYFKAGHLIAVDAINNAKAYVLGMKFIKTGKKIDQLKLVDHTLVLKPANIEKS